MTIRFLPFWLGIALGHMLYVFCPAVVNENEQNIPWAHQLLAACFTGLIASSFYVAVTATAETKRRGSAKVRLW